MLLEGTLPSELAALGPRLWKLRWIEVAKAACRHTHLRVRRLSVQLLAVKLGRPGGLRRVPANLSLVSLMLQDILLRCVC